MSEVLLYTVQVPLYTVQMPLDFGDSMMCTDRSMAVNCLITRQKCPRFDEVRL